MICKNCNTAIEDSETKCPHCGTDIKKNNKLPVIAVILVLLAIAVLLYLNSKKMPDYSDEIPVIPPEIEENFEEEADGTENIAEAEPEVVIEDDQPLDINEADLTKEIDDVWRMLDDAANAANQYFDKYSETVTFVSKNGYLYEVPSKSYVMANDLADLTDLPLEYESEGILFFYIRPNDLKEYLGRQVSDSEELTIFTAYETKEGFAVTAKNEAGGIIPRENLQKVLENYKWDHGKFEKVAYDSNIFINVLATISRYEDYDGAYDVRYMYRDEKYIVVVFSKEGQHNVLQEYILEDLIEVVVVRAANIQDTENYRAYANTILPDFNLDLLADYNISEFSKYIVDGFDEIVEGMISGGIITEEDLPVTFETGAQDFIYIEFASGKNYLGYIYGGTWELALVEDYELMIEYMKTQVRKPPYFIIKQY